MARLPFFFFISASLVLPELSSVEGATQTLPRLIAGGGRGRRRLLTSEDVGHVFPTGNEEQKRNRSESSIRIVDQNLHISGPSKCLLMKLIAADHAGDLHSFSAGYL